MSAPITASQIARLAGVSRSAVSNWRRRHADFPAPLGEGAGASPLFDRAAVERWLHERGLSTAPADTVDALRLAVSAGARRLPEDAALAVAICALAGERPDGPKEAEPAIVAAAQAVPHPLRAEVAEDLLRERRGGRRRAAEHESDGRLARFMVALAGRPRGRVVDPAAGFATLLLLAARAGEGGELNLHGREINPRAAAIARARLALHGIDAEITVADALAGPPPPPGLADLVLCEPPIGQCLAPDAVDESDPRWLSRPSLTGVDLLWVQHASWLARAAGGRAFVVSGRGAAFRRGTSARTRAALLERGLIEAVIGLPAGAGGRTTRVPLALWVLRGAGAAHEPRPVLLAESTDLADAERIRELLGRARTDARAIPAGRGARMVTIAELLTAEANLDPAHWLAPTPQERVAARKEARAALREADRRLRAASTRLLGDGHGSPPESDAAAAEALADYERELAGARRAAATLRRSLTGADARTDAGRRAAGATARRHTPPGAPPPP